MPSYRKGDRTEKRKKPKVIRRVRKFVGNQHTSKPSTSFTTTSASQLSTNADFNVNCESGFSYCILAFSIVFSALASMLKCKSCDKDVTFTKTAIRGLGFKINIACDCGNRGINSSKLIKTGYEINRRIVFVMRLLGVGRNSLDLFCSLMDMTSSFSKTTYYRLLEYVKIATKTVADVCLKKVGAEEKQKNEERNLPSDELSVSGDGTWSKRGFSSLIGVATVIGKYSGKVYIISFLQKRVKLVK